MLIEANKNFATQCPAPIVSIILSFLPSNKFGDMTKVCKLFRKHVLNPNDSEVIPGENYKRFLANFLSKDIFDSIENDLRNCDYITRADAVEIEKILMNEHISNKDLLNFHKYEKRQQIIDRALLRLQVLDTDRCSEDYFIRSQEWEKERNRIREIEKEFFL